MTTTRKIMHSGASCVGEHQTLATTEHVRELGVVALPIRGDDGRPHEMIIDRDIVIKCIAAGLDPATTAGELAQGSAYHVDAGASIEEMLTVMEKHQTRRHRRVRRSDLLPHDHHQPLIDNADAAGRADATGGGL